MASIVHLSESYGDLGDSIRVTEEADRISARLSRAAEGAVMDLTPTFAPGKKIWIPIDIIGPIQEA